MKRYPFLTAVLASDDQNEKEFQELFALLKEINKLSDELNHRKGIDPGKLLTIPTGSNVREELEKLKAEMEKLKASPEYKSLQKDQRKEDKRLLKKLGSTLASILKEDFEFTDDYNKVLSKELAKMCKRAKIPCKIEDGMFSGPTAILDTGARLRCHEREGKLAFSFIGASEDNYTPSFFFADGDFNSKVEQLKNLYEKDKEKISKEDAEMLKKLGLT